MSEEIEFVDKTRRMLINRPAYLKISKIASDINVSVGWLNQFANGKIASPGVVKICALNMYLKNAAYKEY